MKIYTYEGKANISGDRIHQARTAQRLSQDALAAKLQVAGLGIGREAISRIETGLRFVTDYERMNNENMAVYPPYRLVAQFADGARLLFDGLTEAQAQQSMEAAQAQHGDIAWYDGVTDLHYENGKYYKLIPPPPEVTLIDLTEYTGPLDENGLPPSLTGNPPADHETGPNDHK